MKVRNKISVGLSLLSSIILVWYLFVKESDYCISFKVQTASGTISQGIMDWTTVQTLKESEEYTVMEKKNFNFIKQEMKKGNVQMEYTWNIQPINDSITKISVGIKDLNHSLYNRLTVPFFTTAFKKEQIKKISSFKDGLNEHLQSFKISVEGEGASEETFVAYINLKSVLQEKAQTMIINDAIITEFLQQNKVEIIGKPYLEIQNWNLDKETIDFNYCFPVDKKTKIIRDKVVKFKKLPSRKGLKATYFGNFRTSDRAWFSLLDYAKRHHYKLENKPLEHFLDNPFNGGNEIEWKTEIIIPFEKE